MKDMEFMRLAFFLTVVCLIVSCLFGCGENVRLRGKVTFSDTQEPLTCGEIHFSTPTFLARATIQPDGTYSVGSMKESDGLPPGTYSIAIVNAVEEQWSLTDQPTIGPRGLGQTVPEKLLIDPKYKNKATSGLSVTVDQSSRVFDFEVDRFNSK